MSGADLSSRELEIVRLIGRGSINKEIAEQLTLSGNTVKNHITTIFTKLRMYKRAEVAVYAWKTGLLNDNSSNNLNILPSEYYPLSCIRCEETVAYAKSHTCLRKVNVT
jgi:DNA-binding CsgD family transcriptional regulator